MTPAVRPPRWGWRVARWVLLGLCAVRIAAQPVPVMVQSAPGRVEVSAVDASAAHAVVALAEETWRLLAAPLGLPPAFSAPVFVRLVATPDAATSGNAYGAEVAAGGVVSVWLQWPEGNPPALRVQRAALVRGLLLRLGVALHGAPDRVVAPWWLEAGLVGWCETRAHPAQWDALKQETEQIAPPEIAAILARQRGHGTRADEVGATWLAMWLQGESGGAGEWPGFVRAVLGGADANAALDERFGARFGDRTERELWWQTGWHQLRRTRSLPVLEAAESRVELAALARFVFAPDERDRVLPLRSVLAQGRDAVVLAELRRRIAELARIGGAVHPFYRNAALSLREAFEMTAADAAKREAACVQFERDWQAATELEAASRAALDRLEGRPAAK